MSDLVIDIEIKNGKMKVEASVDYEGSQKLRNFIFEYGELLKQEYDAEATFTLKE